MTKQLLRDFLADYPLFRKAVLSVPGEVGAWPHVPLQLACAKCRSSQTFLPKDHFGYTPTSYIPVRGLVLSGEYNCAACTRFTYRFFIKVDYDLQYIVKIGQDPAWEPRIEEFMLKALGSFGLYYRKALHCEANDLGVGALAYYRKALSFVLDPLLTDLREWIAASQGEREADQVTAALTNSDLYSKLRTARQLLPRILQPNSLNPFELLESLYAAGDRPCEQESMVNAKLFRQALVFLTYQLSTFKSHNETFVSAMKQLLQDRAQATPSATEICAGSAFQDLAGTAHIKDDETAIFTNSDRSRHKTRSHDQPGQ
jgi:hypothetical protein